MLPWAAMGEALTVTITVVAAADSVVTVAALAILEAAVAGEIFMEGGKGDGLDAHAIPVAMDDVVDGTEDEEAEFVGSTPVLSPVWVEKRRHTSRG